MTSAATIASLDVAIRSPEVCHFLDYPEGRSPPERIEQILDEVLLEARGLVAARGAFVHLDVSRASDIGLPPLAADALVIGLVTAGPAIEARVQEHSDAGNVTRALLLDAAGSAAAEEAANLLSVRIAGTPEDTEVGEASCRLSPGYGRWELLSQPALFALLPHATLGVSLTPSHMMVPRKSISFAMWLGPHERASFGLGGCEVCTLTHCRYRRSPPESEGDPESPEERS